jgi:hypothetical protein
MRRVCCRIGCMLRTHRLLAEIQKALKVRISLAPPRSLQRRESWLQSSQNCSKWPQFRESCPQTGLEKVSHFTAQATFAALFSGGPIGSPVSRLHGANAMRSQIDEAAKAWVSGTRTVRNTLQKKESGAQECALAVRFRRLHQTNEMRSQTDEGAERPGFDFGSESLAIRGAVTPVLAKHSKSCSLIDCISVGVDRIQRNFGPMRTQEEAWQRSELRDVTAKVVISLASEIRTWRKPSQSSRAYEDSYGRGCTAPPIPDRQMECSRTD